MSVRPALRASLVAAVAGAMLLAGACGSTSNGSSSGNRASADSSTVDVHTGNPSSPVTIQEAGSSLIYPYLQQLTSPLKAQYPNITLSPAAGGSGVGQSEAASGTIDAGGSDAYLTPAQFQQFPGLMNVPIAISSQAVNFNLKGISSLNLSGSVLAAIYMGKVTRWNDQAIAGLNPGVTLPDETIVPIRRVDSSGDTFIFTSFLSQTSSAWQNGPSLGTTVTWPSAPGELAENGNPGMVNGLKSTPGGIAYVGISAESDALQAGAGEAALKNKAGKFVKSSPTTVQAAVQAGAHSIPGNLAASLIYMPGAQSYPIVNYEYLIVQSRQTDRDKALALRSFFVWAIDPKGGATESNLAAVNFQPLPSPVVPAIKKQINRIQGG